MGTEGESRELGEGRWATVLWGFKGASPILLVGLILALRTRATPLQDGE